MPEFTTHGQVYGNGTVHIPQHIRRALNLDDGDVVVWVLENGSRAVIYKATVERVHK